MDSVRESRDSPAFAPETNLAPVLVVSPDNRILYANPASWLVLRQWATTTGEHVSAPWVDVLTEVRRTGTTDERTISVGPVHTRLLFVPHANDGTVHVYGADATSSRQSVRDELIKAHVYSQAQEAVLLADDEFRAIDINPAYTRLTGYTESDALGETPSFLLSARRDEELYAAISESLHDSGSWSGELWDRDKDGRHLVIRTSITAVRQKETSTTHYVVFLSDVTHNKIAEEQLFKMAHYDSLTGLPNRYLFSDHIHNAISHARRTGEQFAVMLVDLDGFKLVNDTLGHRAGDRLLHDIGRRMAQAVRTSDLVARFGGDEFALLVRDIRGKAGASVVARKVLDAVGQLAVIDGAEMLVTASIGIALYPDDQTEIEPLIRLADGAMYKVKLRTKNDIRFVSDDAPGVIGRELRMHTELRKAVDTNELRVHYQPQVNVATGMVTGVEALARWNSTVFGEVAPDEFIPIAENFGLIGDLGRQVLAMACAQGAAWRSGTGIPLRMAVNVSASQLRTGTLASVVEEVLDETGFPGNQLELELTESVFIDDAAEVLPVLRMLADAGVRLAIDDFGTRYASLMYIKTYPVHRLKIDKSFVRDTPSDTNSAQIVRTIITLANSLGCDVIAEGVETAEQRTFLADNGCSEIQGYLCSPPVEASGMEPLFRSGCPPG